MSKVEKKFIASSSLASGTEKRNVFTLDDLNERWKNAEYDSAEARRWTSILDLLKIAERVALHTGGQVVMYMRKD